jgi:hypothetical protein
LARFTDEELVRYSRHMIVPEVGGVGQMRLRAAKATAGCEVEALYLAACGVGTIVVRSPEIAESVRALNPLVAIVVEKGEENEHGNQNENGFEEAALRAWRKLKETLAL